MSKKNCWRGQNSNEDYMYGKLRNLYSPRIPFLGFQGFFFSITPMQKIFLVDPWTSYINLSIACIFSLSLLHPFFFGGGEGYYYYYLLYHHIVSKKAFEIPINYSRLILSTPVVIVVIFTPNFKYFSRFSKPRTWYCFIILNFFQLEMNISDELLYHKNIPLIIWIPLANKGYKSQQKIYSGRMFGVSDSYSERFGLVLDR